VSTDREVTRIVRSWLNEDRHEDAERVLNSVLTELDTILQRRSPWLAWRHLVMNNSVRLGLAAAAVVIVAFIGYQLVSGSNVGSPGPVEPPPPLPTATPAPSPTPANFADYPDGTALTPGSYVFTHVEPLRVTFTVPSGWEKGYLDWVVFSVEGAKARLAVVSVDNLYVDPCQPELGLRDPAVGPTVDDLVTAVGSVPGVTFSTPTDVTLAGFEGKYLEYIQPDTFGECAADVLLWSVNQGSSADLAPAGGEVFRLWILDVNGTRLVISTSAPAGIPSGRVVELEAIIDSIRID